MAVLTIQWFIVSHHKGFVLVGAIPWKRPTGSTEQTARVDPELPLPAGVLSPSISNLGLPLQQPLRMGLLETPSLEGHARNLDTWR